MMTSDERRNEPRATAASIITFECFQQGVKITQGYANTLNLSEHGALVELPCDVENDMQMVLSVIAPLYTLIIEGDVIHSRQISANAYHVGIKLTNAIEGNVALYQADVREHLGNSDDAR